MIKVTYKKPKKLACKQSIFLEFPYSQVIVNAIRLIQERHYDTASRIWEINYCELSRLKSMLPEEEFKITGKPIDDADHRKRRALKKYELPKGLKLKLYSHQVEGFQEIMNCDNFLLLDSTGVGKGPQAIATALARKELGAKHTLVICGIASLVWNWYSEIGEQSIEDRIVLGAKRNRKGQLKVKSNPDKLADLKNIKNIKEYFIITNIETLRDKPIVEVLRKLCKNGEIDYIIVDEIHNCKNYVSQQTKGLLKLEPKYRCGMSGTLVINSPIDLYVPLKWVKEETASLGAFKQRYAIWGGFGGYTPIKYIHLDELQAKLDKVSIRRTKEEVLDLPPKVYKTEFVELGAGQQKIYNAVLEQLIANIDKIKLNPNPLSQLTRLRQTLADTSILSSTIHESAKFDRLDELLDEIIGINGEKVLIFSNWSTVTDIAQERLKKYNPAIITGQIKDRQAEKEKFMADDTCKVCIATIKAGGTGFTLTAATTVIFLDLPWTDADFQQATDRIYRIGTTSSVLAISLIVKNTVDERIQHIVQSKKILSDALIDHKFDLTKEETLDYLLGK